MESCNIYNKSMQPALLSFGYSFELYSPCYSPVSIWCLHCALSKSYSRESYCSSIIPHSPHASAGLLHKLAAMPNMLQSAHSFIHPLLLLLLLLLLLHCPPLYPSSLPQPHPALHHYLSLYLPAFLGHSAPPTFIHTTPCFVFVQPGWGDGGKEARMKGWFHSCFNNKEEEEVEVASWRAYLSLS